MIRARSHSPLKAPANLCFMGSAFCLLLLLGSLGFVELALTLKLFVDHLTLGISFTKTYLFLAYLATALALLGLSLRARRASDSEPRVSSLMKILGFGLLLLHLLAVAQQLYFTHHLGLAPGKFALAYHDYDYAKTSLAHVHVSKTVLGQWFSEANYRFDGGDSFLPYFSRFWLLIHFFVLAVVTGLALVVIRRDLSHYPLPDRVVLLLCLFVLLETTVDGGPLSSQCLAAGALALRIVRRTSWFKIALLLLPLLLLLGGLTAPLAVEHIGRFLATILILLAVRVIWDPSLRVLWRSAAALALVASTLLVPLALHRLSPRLDSLGIAYSAWRYALTPLHRHQLVYIVSLGPLKEQPYLEVKRVEEAGPYRLQEVWLKESMLLLRLCKDLELNVSRFPVRVDNLYAQVLKLRLFEPYKESHKYRDMELAVPLGASINFAVARLGAGDYIIEDMTLQRAVEKETR